MCDGGVMVSIVAFQAVDPSSILGHRINHFLLLVFLKDSIKATTIVPYSNVGVVINIVPSCLCF
jgi:hypothetical protein